MKRFLVFVIICVVSLGVGFTVFRFMTLEELIFVNQTVFEVNIGNTFTLDIVTENLKAGHSVTATIADPTIVAPENAEKFEFSAVSGGKTTITISSDVEGFTPVRIQVTVGSGDATSPYFVNSVEDLVAINGDAYRPFNRYYKLTTDISLTNVDFTPIANGVDAGFTGSFNFNGHTISGLNLTTSENIPYAGLFAKIGTDGVVSNVKLQDCNVNGNFEYAGVLAGINDGTVTYATVSNSVVRNENENAIIGGMVGLNSGSIYKSYTENNQISATGTNSIAGGLVGSLKTTSATKASVSVCYAKNNVSASKFVGGLTGENKGALIENCYTGSTFGDYKLSSQSADACLGGISGLVEYTTVGSAVSNAAVIDCYTVINFDTTATNKGAIIGKNTAYNNSTSKNEIFGNYYISTMQVAGIATGTTANDDSSIGIYSKSMEELTSQSTYYSYTDGTSDYYWTFDKVWEMNGIESLLPSLNFEGPYVPTSSGKAKDPSAITSVSDLLNLNGETGDYKLLTNLTLTNWTPIDFNGRLYCPLKQDGTSEFTIELQVASDDYVNDGCVALFKELGSNAVIENITITINVSNVTTAGKIASIASVNKGVITNCKSSGTITTNKVSESVYLGGIAAENFGTIQNSESSVAINMTTAPQIFYNGGIAAYNYANSFIDSCNNNGTLTISTQSQGNVGGIAGQNEGTVNYCINNGKVDGAYDAAEGAYYGGLVGYLGQAKLTKSSNFGMVKGTNIGGIVGYANGVISECQSQASLEGQRVGGLVCVQALGSIDDCVSINTITGKDDNSVICGIAYQVYITVNGDAVTRTIFSATQFLGSGTKYYETKSTVRGSGDIFAGFEPDPVYHSSIYVKYGDAKRSVAKFEAFAWAGYEYDCPVTEEQARSANLVSEVNKSDKYDYNFSSLIWSFQDGELPQLKNVAK